LTGKLVRVEALIELNRDAKAKGEIDAVLKQAPKALLANYYLAMLRARARDFNGAWQIGQNLPPEFVQSESGIALTVAKMASTSGHLESAGAILVTLVSRHPEIIPARLQLAEVRLAQRVPLTALSVLEPLKSSDDAFTQALLAQTYLQLGRYNDAITFLEKTLSSGRDDGLLRRELALSEMQVGNTDEAIKELRELVERNPGDIELAAPLVAVLIKTGKLDDALKIADRMAKGAPRSPLPAFFRGQIMVAKGNLVDASLAFDQSLAVDPKYIPALFYRSNVSTSRGDFDEASKDLQRVLSLDRSNVLAHIKLTQIALDNNQDTQAVAILVNAIKEIPTQPTLRLALANYQVSHGKFQDALATVNGLLQVSSNNTDGLALRGQIQLLLGTKKEAVDTLRLLVATNPRSPAAQVLLAKALNSAQDYLAAEDALKKAVELAPNSAQMRLTLVELQIAQGKRDAAIETARAYRSAFPGPQAELLFADTLIRLKRLNEAATVLTNALASKPDRQLAMRLSDLALTSGDLRKGVTVLSGWLAKHPDDFEVRLRYASTLLGAGDQATARKEFEILLKQRPEDTTTLNDLSWILQKDDPARSLSLISLAARIAPRSADITDTLGWIKLQHRDQQGALIALQRAHNLAANNAGISYHLAVALDAAGKRAEAKTLLQSVLARNPKFNGVEDARQLVARW
jgi:putative PEP-CTERM system TPR-repeat lipoprotein